MAVVPDPCGESDRTVYIERGKDDDTFRLNAVSTQVCSRLFDKIDWDAILKKMGRRKDFSCHFASPVV
jgi:hypothetical protein